METKITETKNQKPVETKKAEIRNEIKSDEPTKILIIYCPPFVLSASKAQELQAEFEVSTSRKLDMKSLQAGTYLVQSLERVPSLKNKPEIDAHFILFQSNSSDMAVKNQLLEGPEDFFVDDSL